ncbi:complex I subunit 5 family protein [Legionella cincinnatiensis]|uniref:NADH-quinone oxidoreductase chain L n=1 Tax=Legionella cincinnatiensis TaxID=28085 RepID=A0A378IQF5_9GAMM|nr:proton-conducting transporter membrane subunit [Legionella cincinnatiensis]KTC92630.1 NADH-quinone oxidoreductase chain L [Legionella cincinnatiensis]STX34244.1 NADH-quinone oxidoreductase chain L [Legionella cincinnatiensis]
MYNLAVLPILLPFLTAMILLVVRDVLSRKFLDSIALATTLAVTLICILLMRRVPEVYWFGNQIPVGKMAVGIAFVIDFIAASLATFTSFLTFTVFIYSWSYFKAVSGLYHSLMLLFLGAMIGFCFTGDLFNLFVFFELMSVAAFALTAYKNESQSALQGALNFVITNMLGGMLILLGVTFIYSKTGALNFAQIGALLQNQTLDNIIITSFVLMTIGFLIKAAIAPFHFWLADAHTVAPTPVSVLLSGIMAPLGLYGFLRVYWTMYAAPLHSLDTVVTVLFFSIGTITILIASIMCFIERSLKRMLAFSTISNSGIILIGISTLKPLGIQASMIYILAHGFLKGSLFMCSGVLLHHFRSVDELDLQGKGKKIPFIGLLFFIGIIGLAGLPAFGVFTAKNMIEASMDLKVVGVAFFLILFESIVTTGAFARVFGRVFLGWGMQQKNNLVTENSEEQETQATKKTTPIVMGIPIVLLLLAPVVLNYLYFFNNTLSTAANEFQNRIWYYAVVYNETLPVTQPVNYSGNLKNYIFEFTGILIALFIGFLNIFKHFIPFKIRKITDTINMPFITILKSLQSGLIGDYLSWIIFGTTIIGLAFLRSV